MATNGARYAPRDFNNGCKLVPEEGPNEGKPYTFGDIDTIKIAPGGSTKEIPGLDGAVLCIVPGLAKPTFELGASSSEETVGAIRHLDGGVDGEAYSTRFKIVLVGQRRGVNNGNPRTYEIPGCILSDGGGIDLGSDSPPKDSIKASGSDLLIDGVSLFKKK